MLFTKKNFKKNQKLRKNKFKNKNFAQKVFEVQKEVFKKN